ncbi:MAG: transcription elongation factor GreA [Bacilli bacterium]|nr:transcription elongation factor GreA [Bacilli bacterium]
MENNIILTPEGYLELEQELNYLKNEKRPEVITALKEARAQGDLSENADYDAARDEQAKVEGRIKQLEYQLEHSTITDNAKKDSVAIGTTVTVLYVEEGDEEVYQIVGSLEADPFENKISNESPIGAAIMGKKVGDVISVDSPNGAYDIKITKIA